ncbi:MAG: GGDEF domain-containing protein [Rhodospirillales bacterium]|nr:GGDEF domain-containing protein [Rhodospirillales bacterium]MCW8862242.1 GGDEF domain-containing protein [Rhodospirillales bacterium]MCW8952000.1 GGDEF domain-containing protein [Rhodospirillales bacterium]MCW8969960.1 GGDEF domain-containing protein [Rhodospirillales bacterium]MCW9039528.1 GGDEF domain-containing protein [Rhodospirillales bacterium]
MNLYQDNPAESLVSKVKRLAEVITFDTAHSVKGAGNTDTRSVTESIEGVMSDAILTATAAERIIARQFDRIAELERLAITDDLTGLFNRRGFEMELQRSMANATRHKETAVVVFIDLDGFKPINDTYGHAAGDAVLQQVAGLLRDGIRETDAACRIGGDEFAVILNRSSASDGLHRATGFDEILNGAGMYWGETLILLGASTGSSIIDGRQTADEVIHAADMAMYESKRKRSAATAWQAAE